MEEKERSPKPNLLSKLKDGIEDTEQHIQVLGTFVRLGVVVWSGFIWDHNSQLRRDTDD